MPDFSEWNWPIYVLIGVAIYYLGLPILIRFVSSARTDPTIDTISPDGLGLPGDVALHFHRVRSELIPNGFEVIEGLSLPDFISNVKMLALLMINRAEKEAALATVMTAGGVKMKMSCVMFATRFRDGTVFETNNSDELSAFQPRPSHTLTQFPSIGDAGEVYRLHRALINRDGPASPRFLSFEEEFRGDSRACLKASLLNEFDYHVEIGRYFVSADGTSFRPTWKGAYLMTIALLFPFKSLRRLARSRKERKLLAELST